MAKKLVVVLPTFNEKNNIKKFTEEVLNQERYLPGYKVEVVIADSYSPDGTGEIAKKMADKDKRVHYLGVGRGIGVGLIEGHRYSLKNLNPTIMAQLDADGQVEADVLQRMVAAIESGYNLAIGSRFVKGGKNLLAFSRRIFTSGSSIFCRIVMGPSDIKEFSNSARAFTPELFKKINLNLVPWQEKTFIIQPAFLNAAVVAGAKYKEVPLVFKDRAEGYSKMKTVNYTYDVVTYAIDARLHKLGLKIPFFKLSRQSKTIIKFGLVGITGTVIDFLFYNFFIKTFSFPPATSRVCSVSIAIINNFSWNNLWTFRNRKTNNRLTKKLVSFILVSLGGLLIVSLITKGLDFLYGDGYTNLLGLKVAYHNLYFLITLPPMFIWNFTANHFITWRQHHD